MESGLQLAGRYHRDVLAPLLNTRWPGLPYAAARLGSGSDVLGLDDKMSRDHDWGLRLTLLVGTRWVQEVDQYLAEALPTTYDGRPTRFVTTWDPAVRHRVEVATAEGFVASRLGLDASGAMTGTDWLCLTGQSLLEVTAGEVFTDRVGTLTALRAKLAWYPEDVWYYVVASDWSRLGEDLPLLGRAGQRGDDLGARVIAARVVNIAMHLAFVLDRHWAPYPKWLGSMLARLPVGADLGPRLTAALVAPTWTARQTALVEALDILRLEQQAVGLPTPGSVVEPFFDRPFFGITAATSELLLAAVTDPEVRALPPGVGSIEQWVDGVSVLTDPDRRVRAARLFLGSVG